MNKPSERAGAPVELRPDMNQALADLKELGDLFARFGVELISSFASIREGVPPILLCDVLDGPAIGANYITARFKLSEQLHRCLAALRAWNGDLHVPHGIVPIEVEVVKSMIAAGIEETSVCEEVGISSASREQRVFEAILLAYRQRH